MRYLAAVLLAPALFAQEPTINQIRCALELARERGVTPRHVGESPFLQPRPDFD